ncbi:MAG: flagellar hook-length control protein FliK, partial [Methylohalobius sp.]
PALLSSSDDERKPALGLVSRFKDLATEAESLRPADTTLPVKPGLVSESAFPGGSPQPDILVPDGSPRQDPQVGQIGPDSPSHGGELLSPLTPNKVAGSSPAFPPVPQSGDKMGLELKSLLTSPEWADELGQKLIWMHGKSVQAAEIHLNPPQLGPVAVRIQMHDDQTSIQFASPHAAVREAIEAALPRLKELFNAQQLPLTQVEVSQQSLEDRSNARREQSHASARDYQASAQEDGLEESGKESRRLEVNVGSRLLNLYV